MESISQSSEDSEVPKGVRRRKKRSSIGPRKKRYWKHDLDDSQTDSLPDSADTCEEKEVQKRSHACEQTLTTAHLCSDGDQFSETATGSEFCTDVDDQSNPPKQKKRRKRRSKLAYQRKEKKHVGFLSIKDGHKDCEVFPHTSSSDGSDESDVEVELLSSESEESDISIPDDLSISDTETSDVTCVPQCQIIDHDILKHKGNESSSRSPDVFLQALVEDLKLLLPNNWKIDVVKDKLLRIFKMNTSKSASVDRCIFYIKEEDAMGLFVHGSPIPREDKVFECPTVPEKGNMESLVDFFSELVRRADVLKVCEGITDYEELWDCSAGYLDHSSLDFPCFRTKNCTILIEGSRKKCVECKAEAHRLGREEKRLQSGEASSSRISDKYLRKEAIIIKKNKYKKMLRKERQKAHRLQKKVENLEIKLEAAMKDELSSILRASQHKMSELQKAFWKAQGAALQSDDKRGLRWHPMLVRIALHLHSLSPGAYKFLNNAKVLCLPSERRLFDYSHFIEAKEGCQKEITEHIRKKIEKCGSEEHLKYVNLMCDEMHIRAGLVVKRTTGELVGYTKLDGIDEELRNIQAELHSNVYKPRLAKKVLVYLARGITCHDVKDVVAVYTTDDLSVSQLYDRSWEVIYHLEDFGIKVLSLTCDGASVNRKFIQMHDSLDKSCSYVYSTKNLAAGDSRPLFFIIDPPHLLKTIRNALANSFCHRKSRKLWKNNEVLSWKVIEKIYELSKTQKFPGHKLTKAHIKLTSFSCMTVLYATQVLSKSVGQCIEGYANQLNMAGLHTTELVKFIYLMNRFFDCLNGMQKEEEAVMDSTENTEEIGPDITGHGSSENANPNSLIPDDKAPYKSLDDPRFEFLKKDVLGYFEEWKKEVLNRPGIFTQTERNQMIISHQALGAIEVTVNGFIGAIQYMLTEAGASSVLARVFNQDFLEQFFGKVRRQQGDNRNPSAEGVLHTRLNLHAQGHVSLPSSKGNTLAEKRKEIEVDSSPLPSRKKPKNP